MPGLTKTMLKQRLEAEIARLCDVQEQTGAVQDYADAFARLSRISHALARTHTWLPEDAAATAVALAVDEDAPSEDRVRRHLAGVGLPPEEAVTERARFIAEQTGCRMARLAMARRLCGTVDVDAPAHWPANLTLAS